jgi:hypothetical protein
MKYPFLFLSFCFLTFLAKSQVKPQPNTNNEIIKDSIYHVIGKNIFRINLSSAFLLTGYGDLQLLGNFETRISRDISFNTRAGMCFQIPNTNRSVSQALKPEMGYYFFASAEVKYFFLTKKRIAANRKIANYAGFYISAEQNLLTPPLFLDNINNESALDGKLASYINLGFQKQFGNLFFSWSVGASPFRINLSDKNASLVPAQSWLCLGYVFGPSK